VVERPFEVPIAKGKGPAKNAKVVKAVIYGDVHFPEHDDKAIAILEDVTSAYQPDVLICVGDLASVTFSTAMRSQTTTAIRARS
jgi:hypothetical protein